MPIPAMMHEPDTLESPCGFPSRKSGSPCGVPPFRSVFFILSSIAGRLEALVQPVSSGCLHPVCLFKSGYDAPRMPMAMASQGKPGIPLLPAPPPSSYQEFQP